MTSKSQSSKYPIFDDIDVPENVYKSWQVTVDLLAKIANIPAALIMRVHSEDIEVFVSSDCADNVYSRGEKTRLDANLYCETVMNTQQQLEVHNALNDPNWKDNPDIKLGMISYCGMPLMWPDNRVFGTLCILDTKEHACSPAYINLMQSFKDSLEYSLHNLYEAKLAKHELSLALHESKALGQRYLDVTQTIMIALDSKGCISMINRAGQALLGYTESELLGHNWFATCLPQPEGLDKVYPIFRDIISGQRAAHIEHESTVRCRDSSLRLIGWHNTYFRNDKGQVTGLLSSGADITERKRASEKLKSNLLDFVATLAATLEMRDPYTAGHERRVAEIAVGIAKILKLPDIQIEGLHLAAIVHDVGKIHIPAEILNKPGKISDIEFSLIKEHSQSGYELLKNIDFPWPIAQIVLQHHERLDGSGYPQGLKGDQILIEAKIMAVADVVESMMSHRPYRPALGIDAALNEIEKHKGTLFSEEVVDACIKLFRVQGFSFMN